MSTHDDSMHRVNIKAAEWYALLRSGDATDIDRDEWRYWLDASTAHRQAWETIERVSRRFAPIAASIDPRATVEVLQTARSRTERRRHLLVGLTAFAGAGLLSRLVSYEASPINRMIALTATHRTDTGEIREIALADSSRIWLASASAVDEEFRIDQRRLQLVAGEIHVRTAQDAHRPFVVDTPDGRVRAIGTRFSVRHEEHDEGRRTFVAVYAGAVEIRTASTGSVSRLAAGQQTRFDHQGIDAKASANPSRESWTRGLLVAHDMPLSEVAAELSTYRHGHLAVAPEIASLRVFGSFPLRDTERALAMLVDVLPIEVRRPLPWWYSIEARYLQDGHVSGF